MAFISRLHKSKYQPDASYPVQNKICIYFYFNELINCLTISIVDYIYQQLFELQIEKIIYV